MIWDGWKHITKLDPDKPITPEVVKTVVESGTDAVMISGTQRITSKKISKLMEMLREAATWVRACPGAHVCTRVDTSC